MGFDLAKENVWHWRLCLSSHLVTAWSSSTLGQVTRIVSLDGSFRAALLLNGIAGHSHREWPTMSLMPVMKTACARHSETCELV